MNGSERISSGASGRNTRASNGAGSKGASGKWAGVDWERYVVGIDMPLQAYGEKPTASRGVYFLFAGDGGLLYVGRSVDIHYRLDCHQKSGKDFHLFGCIEVPDEHARGAEAAYIDALDPCLNQKPELACVRWLPDLTKAIKRRWASVERRAAIAPSRKLLR